MDQPYIETTSPISHYEIVVLNHDTNYLVQRTKWEAYNYMDRLEGWCSKSKASILIDLVCMLKPKTIVEIGVWGGKSLIPMAHAQRNFANGITYGIDPWDNIESVDGMDGVNYEWWISIDHKKILTGLQNKIVEFGLHNNVMLVPTSSLLAPLIYDIDILHIDGNHSKKASDIDVQKWVPQVRRGGIVIFDDITWGTNGDAVKWLDDTCIRLAEFREDCAWAVWIKP